jgi:hypothetical protein
MSAETEKSVLGYEKVEEKGRRRGDVRILEFIYEQAGSFLG